MTSLINRLCRGLIVSILLAFSNTAFAAVMDMRPGVTDISRRILELHHLSLAICVVMGSLVFGTMFYSMYAHRRSKHPKPADFHESLLVEIIWTAVPILILIGLAIPATSALREIEDNSNPDLSILITGSQWKWHYQYLEADFGYYSNMSTPAEQINNLETKGRNYILEVDNALVLPTNKKVRFLTTSDDVIHSWWVPDFAVKKDANPGFINESWAKVNEPGIYRGQCAELCGKDHGYMPVVVIAKPPEEFDAWMAEQEAMAIRAKEEEQRLLSMNMSMDELMREGERVYNATCAACHMPNGEGLPGVFPALKGSKMALEDQEGHINIVLHGKAGTAMQAFGKMLSLKDIAAVVTYERNAWGNNTGDMVQAKDVNDVANGN